MEAEAVDEKDAFENTQDLASENFAFAETLGTFLKEHGSQMARTIGTKDRIEKLMTN